MGKTKVQNRLKEVRKEKNITQVELSEKTGIGQDRISRYEQGKPMTIETMKRIVQALDVSADYFLGLVDKPKCELPIN
jgi:transcriptional regulator with XRE-family HTH domain